MAVISGLVWLRYRLCRESSAAGANLVQTLNGASHPYEPTSNTQRRDTMMERLGFIGLGIMGKPMALHLLKAGHPFVVLNRSPVRRPNWSRQGRQPGNHPGT